MKNAYAIGSIGHQLSETAKRLESLANDIQSAEQGSGNLEEVLANLLVDELEHIQILTLKLTDLVTTEPNSDGTTNTDGTEGSVFAAGDLDSKKREELDGAAVGGVDAK